MSLSPQQQLFVEEYLIDLNGTAAAIRAGYAENSARGTASRLLANANIAAALSAAQQARSKRTEINADWVLKRLVEEAEADIADLYDDHGNLKPVRQWPKVWRQGLVTGLKVEELFSGRGEKRKLVGAIREVKHSDRIKRVELIGKHIGVQAFREQVGLGDKDGNALVPPEAGRELARALAFALAAGKQAADKAGT